MRYLVNPRDRPILFYRVHETVSTGNLKLELRASLFIKLLTNIDRVVESLHWHGKLLIDTGDFLVILIFDGQCPLVSGVQ